MTGRTTDTVDRREEGDRSVQGGNPSRREFLKLGAFVLPAGLLALFGTSACGGEDDDDEEEDDD